MICFFTDKNSPEYAKYIVRKLDCLFNPIFDDELIYPSDLYHPLIDPMEKQDEEFRINILDNTDYYKIYITQTNKYYFKKVTDAKTYHDLIFTELKKYAELKKSKVKITEFLKSFTHTSTLENVFSKTPFIVENGGIYFLYDDNPRKFIHMCEFYIDEFKFNCSGSYMFFENMITKEQYLYYGD